ncbi:hypothetical protein Y032_0498g2515 [Ancylostoma ceylanicum]|uniref:Uncharacterized protein n=1 Tax=Ancylostoma ceylanicum TaxID=53326 RepID=A0A016WUA5_9BILA|nr:hypothetical protein Y032_0498g2515 [Ancylostoma ceylanicum]
MWDFPALSRADTLPLKARYSQNSSSRIFAEFVAHGDALQENNTKISRESPITQCFHRETLYWYSLESTKTNALPSLVMRKPMVDGCKVRNVVKENHLYVMGKPT